MERENVPAVRRRNLHSLGEAESLHLGRSDAVDDLIGNTVLRSPPRLHERRLHIRLNRRVPLDNPELAGLEVRLEGRAGGASGERGTKQEGADVGGGAKEEESGAWADVLCKRMGSAMRGGDGGGS